MISLTNLSLAPCEILELQTLRYYPTPSLSSIVSYIDAKSYNNTTPSKMPSISSVPLKISSCLVEQEYLRAVAFPIFGQRMGCMQDCRLKGNMNWTTLSRCLTFTISESILRYSCKWLGIWTCKQALPLVADLQSSSFAKQIYPSNFVPSPCHRWIKLLEDRGVVSPPSYVKAHVLTWFSFSEITRRISIL